MKILLSRFELNETRTRKVVMLTHVKAVDENGKYIKFCKITQPLLDYIQKQSFDVPDDLIQ